MPLSIHFRGASVLAAACDLSHVPAHLLHPDRPDLVDRVIPPTAPEVERAWGRLPWTLMPAGACGGRDVSLHNLLEMVEDFPEFADLLGPVSGDLIALLRGGVQGEGVHCSECADWPSRL